MTSARRMRRHLYLAALAATLAACVTVNVYFPASAAERAADLFVKDGYGTGDGRSTAKPDTKAPSQPATPTSSVLHLDAARFLAGLWDVIVPSATAQQPDINIATPAITTLKAGMEKRHQLLKPFYASGAVGMSADGLIALRDPALVPLEQRNLVKKMVADENIERNRLYAEIAKANQHPEWEPDIRAIFAQRWIANAPGGWWHQDAAGWHQQ